MSTTAATPSDGQANMQSVSICPSKKKFFLTEAALDFELQNRTKYPESAQKAPSNTPSQNRKGEITIMSSFNEANDLACRMADV